VTPLLKPGANTIAVRAFDPPQDKLIPRGKQYWEPKSKGIFYTRTSGIWQSVWLEATGPAYLERIHIEPDPLGWVNFDGALARAAAGDEFRVPILDGENEISRGSGAISQNRASIQMRVVTPKLWSVETPELYNVTAEVWRKGQQVDRVHSYFGFRTVETHDGRV
jgi:beta-galactosidase/beta-glucuronidase